MKRAVAVLDGEGVKGLIEFKQKSSRSPIQINGTISGLTPGYHGFHIHEYGDRSNGCESAGGHFNPFNSIHGDISNSSAGRHAGDLGNIIANIKGEAIVSFSDKLLTLYGQNSIIGRSLVVHADRDDLGKGENEESKITGNSGKRVACGVIGLAKPIGYNI